MAILWVYLPKYSTTCRTAKGAFGNIPCPAGRHFLYQSIVSRKSEFQKCPNARSESPESADNEKMLICGFSFLISFRHIEKIVASRTRHGSQSTDYL